MSTKPNTSQITYDIGSNKQDLNNILDTVVPIADYTALRNYTGRATQVRITADGIAGFFRYDSTDTTSTDNGGTIIVAGTKRWKRVFDGAVNVKWFGASHSATADVNTLAIQSAINATPSGSSVDLSGDEYAISKGAAHPSYPTNNQPCLVVASKSNFTVKNGKLYVTVHGLSALDFNSCVNCFLDSVVIEGAGNFPPIDGLTGRGEKGVTGKGYFDSALYNLPKTRNNSVNTSGYTGGGYGGNFPQWGGGTATTWGVWNGGYIFNFGDGVAFIDCNGCHVIGCEISHFNGSGVYIVRSSNVVIEKNKFHHNYTSGVEFFSTASGNGAVVTNNHIYENGHPSASVLHENIDPGYGTTTNNGYEPIGNLVITSNVITGNKRKGIDAHSFDVITITSNQIENSGYGISLVSSYRLNTCLIADNLIRNISYGKLGRADGITVMNGTGAAIPGSTCIIRGNNISEVGVAPANSPANNLYGYAINLSGIDNVNISGNTIVNKVRYAGAGIAAPASVSGGVIPCNYTVHGNTVDGLFLVGITTGAGSTTTNVTLTGNIVDLGDVSAFGVPSNQTGIGISNSRQYGQNIINLSSGLGVKSYMKNPAKLTFNVILPNLTIYGSSIILTGLDHDNVTVTATSTTHGIVLALDPRLPAPIFGTTRITLISSTVIRTSDSKIITNIYERASALGSVTIGLGIADYTANTNTSVAGAAASGVIGVELSFLYN